MRCEHKQLVGYRAQCAKHDKRGNHFVNAVCQMCYGYAISQAA